MTSGNDFGANKRNFIDIQNSRKQIDYNPSNEGIFSPKTHALS
jgi:hypothetical protein